ncbi:MAG: gamma-butyrobetaine hydroxylase-like domain-containing protein [Gammaproteobacteria bacterium]
MPSNTPRPLQINYHQKSKLLEVTFEDERHFELPAEYLRVYSPSAEVRGHGPGQEVLQVGKESVKITHIEPVGNYAVCLHFDDGHNTGIYSFEELYKLGVNKEQHWENYLRRLEQAGHKRRIAGE